MPSVERVTVTLPDDLVRDIDRLEKNRSKFIAEAVRREVERRRREELRRSLESPHPESVDVADQDLEEWFQALPEEDVGSLLNAGAGKGVRWVAGEGWVEDET
jgi:Arc/MetJ-type ribon-helix-helix transcriptional regulator